MGKTAIDQELHDDFKSSEVWQGITKDFSESEEEVPLIEDCEPYEYTRKVVAGHLYNVRYHWKNHEDFATQLFMGLDAKWLVIKTNTSLPETTVPAEEPNVLMKLDTTIPKDCVTWFNGKKNSQPRCTKTAEIPEVQKFISLAQLAEQLMLLQ